LADVAEAIRTVIVDDHRMVREGLKAMLRDTAVDVVGEADTTAMALQEIARTAPEVVLLDVRLQGQSGFEACRAIAAQHPGLAVVFLTVYEDEQYVFEALRAGARGYMLKRATAEDIVRVLQDVRQGHTVVDPALTGQIALRASKLTPGHAWPGSELGITERESDVLKAMVDGLNNRAVAEKLFISEDTVKTHVRAIFRKLAVSERSQAVAMALREGLFK
jgi:DNA-binding NarL/FixJ family response regulator